MAVRATGVLQLDKHTVTQAEVDQYKRDVLDTKNPKQMQYGRDRVGDVIREFYLKDLEVTVLSAATQPAGEWGAADAGVRIRLRALTEAIEAGLFPRLAIDIRNQAAGTLAVASEFLELEVDGQWYGHQQFDSLFIGPVDLPAGQGQDGYLIPPWGQWWAKDRPNSGLVFLPGRHTIRTALIGRVGAPGAAVRAVSNAVSVDVLTAAAAATRPGVERNQASKPLVMTGESWLRQEQTYHVITVAGRVSSSAATRPAPSTPPRPVGERPEPPSGAGGQGAASRAVP